MAGRETNLDADWWNGVIDELVPWAVELFQTLTKEMLASGYPIGGAPVAPEQEYQNLTQMRDSGLPEFTQSRAASERLATLERQFGAGRPLASPGPVVAAQRIQAVA